MTTPWTWHGGGLAAARRHFGGEDWLDLSTGINPHPWPGVASLAFDWQRLPEPGSLTALEHAAATMFGADPAHVCAVPGTEIGLRLVGALAGRLIDGPAAHVVPSYRTHAAMVPGSAAIPFPAAGAAEGEDRGALILANPNNPDGWLLTSADVLSRSKGWLLVDEAFADCHPDCSVAPLVGEGRKLIVFRSFGKFFGLAGVRLGFVLAPQAILEPLREMLGAWPLSAPALAIGTAAYADTAWIAATRERLFAQAHALDTMLARNGYQPRGACPLFRLVEVDEAAALFERLARQAILTRPFAENPRWLRLGLPQDSAALARLEAALHG